MYQPDTQKGGRAENLLGRSNAEAESKLGERKTLRDISGNGVANAITINGSKYLAFEADTYIGDTAAMCHLTNNCDCIEEVAEVDAKIGGIGGSVRATLTQQII